MLDSANLSFVASWDTAQMSVDEVKEHCDTMTKILKGLMEEESWDREALDVFAR